MREKYNSISLLTIGVRVHIRNNKREQVASLSILCPTNNSAVFGRYCVNRFLLLNNLVGVA